MSDCEDHMDYCGSSREEYECHVCYNRYCSEEDRQEHEVDDHLFCAECDRTFVNKNGIVQVCTTVDSEPPNVAATAANRGGDSISVRASTAATPLCVPSAGTASRRRRP